MSLDTTAQSAAKGALPPTPPERAQALVHTHESPELIARKMDVLGERVTHVHVNHLDLRTMSHPSLAAVEDQLGD